MKSPKPNGQCINCNIFYADKKEFQEHIFLNHTNPNINSCNYGGCNQELVNQNSLARHILTHSGYKPFICNFCEKSFSTSGNVRRHERNVCPNKNQIPMEFNNIESSQSLSNNFFSLKNNRNNSISSLYSFVSSNKQDSNEETNSTLNDEEINLQNILKINLNYALNGERREFNYDEKPLNLSIKKNKLNEDDKFDETEIKNTTNNSSNLINHLFKISNYESINKSSNESVSESSNKSTAKSLNQFANKSAVLIDPFNKNNYKLKNLDKKKKYLCKICNLSIRSIGSLLKHKINHEKNIKPLKCSSCSYSCFEKSGLQRHQLKHTGEKNWCCKLCSRSFSLKTNLGRHIGKKHSHHIKDKKDMKQFIIKNDQNYLLNGRLNLNPIINEIYNSILILYGAKLFET